MNKVEFLAELGSHLLVLEDKEQADILEEYAQHIDMKIENGLSEEEAIQDFGNVKELAADILEAYHVKPEFGGKQTGNGKRIGSWKPDMKKARDEGKKAYASGAHFAGRLGNTSGKLIKCCWNAGKTAARRIADLLTMPWKRWKNRTGNARSGKNNLSSGNRHKFLTLLGRLLHGLGAAITWCWFLFLGCAFWCIRLAFNCAVALTALFTGFCTIFFLFAFGALMVLLIGGYPLAGLTLMSLGMTLCGGAFTVFILYLIRRNKKGNGNEGSGGPEKDKAQPELSEEVQHA